MLPMSLLQHQQPPQQKKSKDVEAVKKKLDSLKQKKKQRKTIIPENDSIYDKDGNLLPAFTREFIVDDDIIEVHFLGQDKG